MNLPSVSMTNMGELLGFFGLTWVSISPATNLLFGIIFGTWLVIKIRRKLNMDDEDILLEKLKRIRALKRK